VHLPFTTQETKKQRGLEDNRFARHGLYGNFHGCQRMKQLNQNRSAAAQGRQVQCQAVPSSAKQPGSFERLQLPNQWGVNHELIAIKKGALLEDL
jgi:hypothetical protein